MGAFDWLQGNYASLGLETTKHDLSVGGTRDLPSRQGKWLKDSWTTLDDSGRQERLARVEAFDYDNRTGAIRDVSKPAIGYGNCSSCLIRPAYDQL